MPIWVLDFPDLNRPFLNSERKTVTGNQPHAIAFSDRRLSYGQHDFRFRLWSGNKA
jgi:hypothetical protein